MTEPPDSLAEHDPLASYLSLREAADVLGIHPDSLRRILARCAVPGARKWRGHQWLFEAVAFQQFASTYSGRPGRPPKGLFVELPARSRDVQ